MLLVGLIEFEKKKDKYVIGMNLEWDSRRSIAILWQKPE